eukprot:334857-Chlamydomonas_euryale.AAC.2
MCGALCGRLNATEASEDWQSSIVPGGLCHLAPPHMAHLCSQVDAAEEGEPRVHVAEAVADIKAPEVHCRSGCDPAGQCGGGVEVWAAGVPSLHIRPPA